MTKYRCAIIRVDTAGEWVASIGAALALLPDFACIGCAASTRIAPSSWRERASTPGSEAGDELLHPGDCGILVESDEQDHDSPSRPRLEVRHRQADHGKQPVTCMPDIRMSLACPRTA
jgi:hypothetical protein